MPPKGMQKVLQLNPETGLAESVYVQGEVEPEIREGIDLEGDDLDKEMVTKTDMLNYVRAEAEHGRHDLVKKTSDSSVIMANVGYIYEKLAKGYPVSKICESLKVSRISWYYVRNNSKYFKELIQLAQQEHVDNVKYSLTKKTEDRYVEAEQVTPSGKVIKYKKYVPADFNAIKFFLLNKASEEFKDKQEVEIRQTNIVVDIIDDVEFVEATPVGGEEAESS